MDRNLFFERIPIIGSSNHWHVLPPTVSWRKRCLSCRSPTSLICCDCCTSSSSEAGRWNSSVAASYSFSGNDNVLILFLLLRPFPYLGSAYLVFNLHVLRSCLYFVLPHVFLYNITPPQFRSSYLSVSTHFHLPCSHYYIFSSLSPHSHLGLASLDFLTYVCHTCPCSYFFIRCCQSSLFPSRISISSFLFFIASFSQPFSVPRSHFHTLYSHDEYANWISTITLYIIFLWILLSFLYLIFSVLSSILPCHSSFIFSLFSLSLINFIYPINRLHHYHNILLCFESYIFFINYSGTTTFGLHGAYLSLAVYVLQYH